MGFAEVYTNRQSYAFDKGLQEYMCLVYKNVGIGLLISAIVSWFVGTSPDLLRFFFSNRLMALLVMFSPLIFSMYFGAKIWVISQEKARNLFFIFTAIMGLSLATIFVVFTKSSIFQTFLTTAGMFGAMSLYGYRTKKDLTSLGSFLMMGVVGILIASILNIFMKSAQVSFTISILGVIIFTLFTAYDVQKIKETYNQIGINSDIKEKVAILGSFQLFLDFVNLFMYLLRFIGRTDDR